MAKIHCSKSGLELEISYFPYLFDKGNLSHPIFSLNTRQLLSLIPKWTGREFTPIDTRLYFLALLNSTNLVEFRTYARPTDSICESNMEAMLRIASWIYGIKNPAVTLAQFAITQDTASLNNIHHWIDIWYQNRKDFEDGYREEAIARDRVIREAALEKLIKTPGKTPENYAATLAEWAAIAGDFPTMDVIVGNKRMSYRDYWKSIIRQCGTKGNVWRLDADDVKVLLEHCEEYIDAGSIYANALFRLLRNALLRQDGVMMMVDTNADIERANVAAIIASAPISKPIESDYPTSIAYLRAKNAWNIAEKHRKENEDSNKLVDAGSLSEQVMEELSVWGEDEEELEEPELQDTYSKFTDEDN